MEKERHKEEKGEYRSMKEVGSKGCKEGRQRRNGEW